MPAATLAPATLTSPGTSLCAGGAVEAGQAAVAGAEQQVVAVRGGDGAGVAGVADHDVAVEPGLHLGGAVLAELEQPDVAHRLALLRGHHQPVAEPPGAGAEQLGVGQPLGLPAGRGHRVHAGVELQVGVGLQGRGEHQRGAVRRPRRLARVQVALGEPGGFA
ncbi:hypothetical protein GCM10020001_089810 [Nonomuraea salmonea]